MKLYNERLIGKHYNNKIDEKIIESTNVSSHHRDVVREPQARYTTAADEPMDLISTKPCVHCAKRHKARCRFRNAPCYKCHKKGHTKAGLLNLTLNTALGLMKMNRLAFGVHAVPGIFQRLMMSVLAGIEGLACVLDDVMVTGAILNKHDQRLRLYSGSMNK